MGRKLFWLILIALAALLLCGRTAVGQSGQEKAKQRRPRRDKVEQRQAKPRDRVVPRERTERGRRREARPRRPEPRVTPEQRHPRPSPYVRPPRRPYLYDPYDYRRPHGQYRWRMPYRHHWYPYRYPRRPTLELRFYFGFRLRPHHGFWSDGPRPVFFYWPYADQPPLGCGWYWVPTRRWPRTDPWGTLYWVYDDYRYLYLCFD